MYTLTVEHRHITAGKFLAQDLALQLSERFHSGKSVVVTDKPTKLIEEVRGHWRKIERSISIERTRATDAARISQLTDELSCMRHVSFTAQPPNDLLVADIAFATVDDLILVAPDCKTMYVTYSFPRMKLHMVTSWMPHNGVVVIYEQG